MKQFLIPVCLLAMSMSAQAAKPNDINLKTAQKTQLNVSVDGKAMKVTWFADNYVTRPNRAEDQKINVYVPENATKQSPIKGHGDRSLSPFLPHLFSQPFYHMFPYASQTN